MKIRRGLTQKDGDEVSNWSGGLNKVDTNERIYSSTVLCLNCPK